MQGIEMECCALRACLGCLDIRQPGVASRKRDAARNENDLSEDQLLLDKWGEVRVGKVRC